MKSTGTKGRTKTMVLLLGALGLVAALTGALGVIRNRSGAKHRPAGT